MSAEPVATVVLQVDGMHCASCGLLIDDTLEDLPGVTRAQTGMRAGRTTVEYDPQRCTVAQLVDAVAVAGYTARVLPAG
jgi:copper chaperone